jgi:hypothetical protein
MTKVVLQTKRHSSLTPALDGSTLYVNNFTVFHSTFWGKAHDKLSLDYWVARSNCMDVLTILLHFELCFFNFLFWLTLEHGASMTLRVSLQFLNLGQSVRLLGRVISSLQGLYIHRTTQT